MVAVNYTTLRDNMKSCFDRISDSFEPMIVTRKKDNMVIMTQDYYDSLMETIYLVGNHSNYDHLITSIRQHKDSKLSEHDLIEESSDD